ncbi:DUF4421 family protein [Niabella hibiscisoli]|uniref:DUF4421 family protein n=1 Tax=Niabella hibiscisoli TaxID=1825928 RepID=UPI001F109FBB|nr:DUF4421 family protein [Niabella hibiscisoli]MCH5719385.1 DUF4421 domain-containing protein [Niabella hibiscisoli]
MLFYIKPLFSQVTEAGSLHVADPIQHFDSLVTFKVNISDDIEALSVNSGSGKIMLRPNAKLTTRFNFSYRYLSFGFSIAPPLLQEKNSDYTKGSSKLRSIGMNLNRKHWQQSAFYSRTKGYYLENTADYHPSWRSGMPYIQFPELIFKQFYGSTAYSFNNRFSPNAVIAQTERQLLSAGSFIPMFNYRYSISDDRSPLLREDKRKKHATLNYCWGPAIILAGYIRRHSMFQVGLPWQGDRF